MASQNNIVKLADFPHRKDSAAVAAERMRKANDDSAYEEAQRAFLSARPTTLAGASAKLGALGAMLESLRDGDTFTDEGWQEAFALFHSVAGTLNHIKARVA